jgi:hypothetical protein
MCTLPSASTPHPRAAPFGPPVLTVGLTPPLSLPPRAGHLKRSAPLGHFFSGGDRGSWNFHWKMKNGDGSAQYPIPSDCVILTGGGGEAACAKEIVDCQQFDTALLRTEGRCMCQSCFPVSHCVTQASDGHSCFCNVCEDGYATTTDGKCLPPTTSSLSVTTSVHPLGARVAFAPDGRYHISTFDNVGHGHPQPNRMQSASCKPPNGPEKIFVVGSATASNRTLPPFRSS